MAKTPADYRKIVKITMAKLIKEAKASGKKFVTTDAFREASARWKLVKAGNDPEFSAGKSTPSTKKTAKKSSKKSMKCKSVKDILEIDGLCTECKILIKDALGKKSGTRKRKSTK